MPVNQMFLHRVVSGFDHVWNLTGFFWIRLKALHLDFIVFFMFGTFFSVREFLLLFLGERLINFPCFNDKLQNGACCVTFLFYDSESERNFRGLHRHSIISNICEMVKDLLILFCFVLFPFFSNTSVYFLLLFSVSLLLW